MATKKIISFALDYSTVKELKERAKTDQKSTSQYLQDLIDKSFFEEKTETRINEIDKKIDLLKEEIFNYFTNLLLIFETNISNNFSEIIKQNNKGE